MKCAAPMRESGVYCNKCETTHHWFDTVMCLYEHTGCVKKSVYDFKFENRRDNAGFYADEVKKIYGEYLKGKK